MFRFSVKPAAEFSHFRVRGRQRFLKLQAIFLCLLTLLGRQVIPDFALGNWTHFLIFSASSFAEASVPASHLMPG